MLKFGEYLPKNIWQFRTTSAKMKIREFPKMSSTTFFIFMTSGEICCYLVNIGGSR